MTSRYTLEKCGSTVRVGYLGDFFRLVPDSIKNSPLKYPNAISSRFSFLFWEQLVELAEILDGRELDPRIMVKLLVDSLDVAQNTRIIKRNSDTIEIFKDYKNWIQVPLDSDEIIIEPFMHKLLYDTVYRQDDGPMYKELLAARAYLLARPLPTCTDIRICEYYYPLLTNYYLPYWKDQVAQESS